MPVTFLYAVLLANQVLRARVRPNQPDWKEATTLRVQANFVENVPLALILLCAVEFSTGSTLRGSHIFGQVARVYSRGKRETQEWLKRGVDFRQNLRRRWRLRHRGNRTRFNGSPRGAPEPGEHVEAAGGGGAVRGVRGRREAGRGA